MSQQLIRMRDISHTSGEPMSMKNVSSSSPILHAVVSIDCVILKFDENQLQILLRQEDSASHWSLPQRLMHNDENASQAAAKLVEELTGRNKPHLDQVYTFTGMGDDLHPAISITYAALINGKNTKPFSMIDKWFPILEIPSLVLNHSDKIKEALTVVRRKATYDPLCFDLLPEKFTLPQLRKLFEEIYGESFDQRNFNKKFKALGLLIKLNEKETSQSKKGAFYYMFDRQKYYRMERPALKFAHLLY